MKKEFLSLFSGVIFSIGLIISGMINPNIVKGFLDIFGDWNYSLIFVMAGAIGVNVITFHLILKKKPLFSDSFNLPLKTQVDKNLIIGSMMFGAGWGIAGVCPGPAVVNVATFKVQILIFIAAMTIGMYLFKLVENKIS